MMRTLPPALCALLIIAAPLGAQQNASVVSSAIASPVLPDIVAVERAVNDRQELQFVRLPNRRVFLATRTPMMGRPGVVVSLPDAGGRALAAYAGQLDWRPVAEQGRSWFAYVASDDNGSLGLMLNYLDANGELAASDPLRIPFTGQVRTPRWSHDGRHIAFVADSSVLYIVPDVSAALRTGSTRSLRVVRAASASQPARFPAWSPSGAQIAYGTEVVSGGTRNGAIEVLPINPTSGEAAGVPVVVTGELSSDDEYRPSWSRDGKYVAFYAERSGAGSARQPIAIGVAEVIANPRTGQSYRGIVKEGSQRWLADDVIADDVRGPAWTSITEGSQRKDAIVFVQHDAARNDPVIVADVQRWIAQLPREQYETVMPQTRGAESARAVSAVELNKRMRFVFTPARGASDNASFRDVAAAWAQGPEPAPAVIATDVATVPGAPAANGTLGVRGHRGQDAGLALLFPGLGQFSAGQRVKGSVLAIVGAAGAAVGITGKSGMSAPLAAGQAAVDAVSRDPSSLAAQTASYNQAKSDFDAQRSKAILGGAVFAAAWLYGIIDASVGSGSGSDIALMVTPEHSVAGMARANIGVSVAVGRVPP